MKGYTNLLYCTSTEARNHISRASQQEAIFGSERDRTSDLYTPRREVETNAGDDSTDAGSSQF